VSEPVAETAPAASRLRRLAGLLGPGIIWSMAAIGQTHVILSTYAGARFGFSLLWMVVLAHLLTYPLFEYGTRYAAATGGSLIDAYLRMRRMRGVLAVFFGVLLLTLPFLGLASLLSVTASILYAAFPEPGFNGWAIVTMATTAGLIFAGRYRWLEALSLAMAGVLVLGTALAFAFQPPAAADLARGVLVPAVPVGSLAILVALMRLPSDPSTSILLSAWAARKREAWLRDGNPLDALRKSLLDLRLGYGFSLVVAIIFLCLGAVVLHPRGVDLEGIDLALQLSRIYTETVGAWMFPLFIGVTFVAIWGGYYTAADGVSRIFQDLWYRNRPRPTSGELSRVRILYILLIMLGSLALATGVQRPLLLVVIAVSVGLIGYPLIYLLNIFAVTRMLEPAYRPSRFSLAIACLGVLYASFGAVMLVLVHVFGFWS
jgi:Mn2+/Fe2+ NRAMP family transporter